MFYKRFYDCKVNGNFDKMRPIESLFSCDRKWGYGNGTGQFKSYGQARLSHNGE